MGQEQVGHPDPTRLWRYRRRHSFIAHWTMVSFTATLVLAELFRPGTVQGLQPMIAIAYSAFVLIVLGYIANCAVEKWAEEKWK